MDAFPFFNIFRPSIVYKADAELESNAIKKENGVTLNVNPLMIKKVKQPINPINILVFKPSFKDEPDIL